MPILERGLEILLAANSDFSLLGLFQLFIIEAHLTLIAIHNYLNLTTKQAQDVHWENQKSGDNRSEYNKKEAKSEEKYEGRERNIELKKIKDKPPIV